MSELGRGPLSTCRGNASQADASQPCHFTGPSSFLKGIRGGLAIASLRFELHRPFLVLGPGS